MPTLTTAGRVALLGIALIAGACATTSPIASTMTSGALAGHGTVRQEQFFSPALGVTKHMMVYLPPSYASHPHRRYPVAIYLHGLTGTETNWLSHAALDDVADSLFATGTPEMIVVMPDGDDGWYSDWVQPANYTACADTTMRESPARYCVQRANYDTYITRDVIGAVDSRFRTEADRSHRAIAGLSMGGYGALELALRHPNLFAAAASHSGVVSPMYTGPHPFAGTVKYAATIDDARGVPFYTYYLRFWGTDLSHWILVDPAHTAQRQLKAGVSLPALSFDCGVEDPYVDQNRALDAELTRLGISHRFAEYPGSHTWRYWTTHVPQSMAWLAAQIGK